MSIKERAVFPIIRSGFELFEEIGGTGFFIGARGLFATAAHILEAVPQARYCAALDAADLKRPAASIKWLAVDVASDLALGRVQLDVENDFLPIAYHCPDVDGSLIGSGFKGGVYREGDGSYKFDSAKIEHLETRFVVQTDQLDISAGELAARRFPALFTVPSFPAGFSGGPVWNDQDRVVGVHSNTSSDEETIARFTAGTEPLQTSVRYDALRSLVWSRGIYV